MNRSLPLLIIAVVIALLAIAPVFAQDATPNPLASGLSVSCTDGSSFDNGVEIRVIQMRSGYTYTATALGINGFDPVLAVLDENGNGLCTDDAEAAASYSASLPSTGDIAPSDLNPQITFSNDTSEEFANVSLIVGGSNNMTGEFLLVLEGMTVSDQDGKGDPFAVQVTPGMVASGIPLTGYMISVTDGLDSEVSLIDQDYNWVADNAGNYISCDNAGDSASCWGQSSDLRGSYVSRTNDRQLPGGPYDAMLQIPLEADYAGGFYNFTMRSPNMKTYGDYIAAFDIGIGDPSAPAASG